MRALGKKTAFGVQVQHTSWLMHEYTTMDLLWRAGAAVPEPVAASDNAVLMSYHGDESMAAPPLNTVGLATDEATVLFAEVMRNVELMLSHGLIHGDLSAYNILYWQDAITIIDFPQVTHSQTNPNAYFILHRDITRVCEYFAAQGVAHDPLRITDTLWHRYVALDPDDAAADASRLE
jgi:RIO kinase 1